MTDTAKVGEIGLPLVINTGFDLTGYSSLSLLVTKPASSDTWTPTVTTLATGVLGYTTVTGDLDEAGRYKVQPYIEFVDGDKRYGEVAVLDVLAVGEEDE